MATKACSFGRRSKAGAASAYDDYVGFGDCGVLRQAGEF